LIVILNDYIRGTVANEETFWSRLEKELDNAVAISTAKLNIPLQEKIKEFNPNLIVQNANWGKLTDYKTISFLQDPFIDMKKLFEPFWLRMRLKIRKRASYENKIQLQMEALNNSIRVTNSNFMAKMYHKAGDFHIIPMGVDHELFKPMEKKELRKKYNLPMNKTIKIFVGSTHKIKGFEKIKKMINNDTASFWILVLKDVDFGIGHNFITFHKISQEILAELYNCADLLVSRSLVESFGLASIEAMFCDLPVDTTKTGIFWDWDPNMNNPRDEAIKKGLDKNTWMTRWKELVHDCIEN
jgi:glycosyltransferase involved in cell wall biosynthesis